MECVEYEDDEAGLENHHVRVLRDCSVCDDGADELQDALSTLATCKIHPTP